MDYVEGDLKMELEAERTSDAEPLVTDFLPAIYHGPSARDLKRLAMHLEDLERLGHSRDHPVHNRSDRRPPQFLFAGIDRSSK